jgi:hypothetical protein
VSIHTLASQVSLNGVGLIQDVAYAAVNWASDESQLMAGADFIEMGDFSQEVLLHSPEEMKNEFVSCELRDKIF